VGAEKVKGMCAEIVFKKVLKWSLRRCRIGAADIRAEPLNPFNKNAPHLRGVVADTGPGLTYMIKTELVKSELAKSDFSETISGARITQETDSQERITQERNIPKNPLLPLSDLPDRLALRERRSPFSRPLSTVSWAMSLT